MRGAVRMEDWKRRKKLIFWTRTLAGVSFFGAFAFAMAWGISALAYLTGKYWKQERSQK